MTTTALKKKIKALVDKETNEKRLARVHKALTTETKAEAIHRRMNEMTRASDKSIQAGRGLTLEEFASKSKIALERIAASRPKAKKAASRKPIARKS